MKYLVTGIHGQLGYDVVKELKKRNVANSDIIAPTSEEMNITNNEDVEKIFAQTKPDVVIHCAAYTNVDGAEKEYEKCNTVNVLGTLNITEASKKIGSKIIYISSDYVFDGQKDSPYDTTDRTNPINNYGKTKLLGEKIVQTYEKHFIVRTSWVFGINGNNFVKTMLKLADNHETLKVVNDQIGSPTYTKDLAKLLCDMAQTEEYGTYHATNETYTNWAQFAEKIFEINRKKVTVIPVTTEQYQENNRSSAERPKKSMLSKATLEKHGFNHLPSWGDALYRYSEELTEKEKKLKIRKR